MRHVSANQINNLQLSKNKSGSNIDPWRSPQITFPVSKNVLSKLTLKVEIEPEINHIFLKLNPCNFHIENHWQFCQLTIISKNSSKMMYKIDVLMTICFISCEIFFTYELQAIFYCTEYELIFTLQTTYFASWGCIVDCVKFLSYIHDTYPWPVPYEIKDS